MNTLSIHEPLCIRVILSVSENSKSDMLEHVEHRARELTRKNLDSANSQVYVERYSGYSVQTNLNNEHDYSDCYFLKYCHHKYAYHHFLYSISLKILKAFSKQFSCYLHQLSYHIILPNVDTLQR